MVAILDFVKFDILNVRAVKGPILRHHAKFHNDQSSGC